ncbi:hypothetical protein ASL20_25765 [Cupriavidus necator]|nr:hypothetical protein C265_14912 [Cupriavidus sp. GA3-3]KUE85972.1 hypothetical protein ASL20_25765 [Cupriavidus necator]
MHLQNCVICSAIHVNQISARSPQKSWESKFVILTFDLAISIMWGEPRPLAKFTPIYRRYYGMTDMKKLADAARPIAP